MVHHLLFDRGNSVLAILLANDRVGGAQVLLGELKNLFLDHRIVGHHQLARLLGGLLRELDDRLDHRLEMPMAEHHCAQHDFLGKLFCFRLHHHHRVLSAGDHEIEPAFAHLVDRRIEHILVVDEADAGGADRSHERGARQRQRGGGCDHGDDIWIVLLVVRQHGDGHLCIAAPTVREQGADRAIDEARRQRVLFGRTALALEIAARNPAGRVVFFGVVHGEWKEIDSFLGLLRRDDRGEHGGLAVGGNHGAVGLTRHFAGFQR